MKAIKIILAVAVIALIGFLGWQWMVTIVNPEPILPAENTFTKRIEQEIDSLSASPASVFCSEFYNEIQYRIDDYHKQGFLGKTDNDNNQWKDILSRNLYSAYAPKFVEQAMYVFSGSDWTIDNLNFIRSEVQTLQSSPYLGQGAVRDSFKDIRGILEKYDEIAGFISSCNNFSYSYYELSDRFPDVSDKVQKSRAYLSSNLDNSYVNNCTRLKEGLRKIPQTLFNTHIAYLTTKIQQNGDRYTEYTYQSDYNNDIYTPLYNQIEELSNDVYGISDEAFDSGYERLYNLLSDYNQRATDYFITLYNNERGGM
jgi:hypothetical protein